MNLVERNPQGHQLSVVFAFRQEYWEELGGLNDPQEGPMIFITPTFEMGTRLLHCMLAMPFCITVMCIDACNMLQSIYCFLTPTVNNV